MDDYIDRETLLQTAKFVHGRWDDLYVSKSEILAMPSADVITKTEYNKLFAAAKAMHTWIFLNTIDEFEVYDECGLTDKMNTLLGSMGRFELKQEVDDDGR